MDFDTAKENIQPLASGRNAEQLETALIAESDAEMHEKLLEQRKEFERGIETYEGDDPLQPWYDYIVWVEQSYPKSGKESAWYELISKCLAKFETDERYFQDRRMLKLYIKYIDCEQNPTQFYEQLYMSGVGTMIADLYLCWAHYYDYCDNFEKAENVYRKGLDARAQPIELLEQAHTQFGFSMSQRLLYKNEDKQKEFRSSMEEKRLALTSLRAHKHRHVGSIRTGSAVKSHNPGRISQASGSGLSENRRVQVFDDTQATPVSPTSSGAASTSVVQTILNSTKKQENLREPGPWSKAKIKSKPLFTGASTSKLAFSILEDEDLIPLADSENNYAKGIQLPPDFKSRNLPQDEFDIPHHRDDKPKSGGIHKYDQFMVFPSENKSFSLEEYKAYKWFKKNNIENDFTRVQAKIWENGYEIPMRLPPNFKRENKPQTDDLELEPFDPKAIAPGRAFGFKIDLIYTKTEEYSPDEILQSKWINGELRSQKDNDMDLTAAFDQREDVYRASIKRRSMAIGGRKSILPRNESPRTSLDPRKSIAPIVAVEQPQQVQPSIPIITEEDEKEEEEREKEKEEKEKDEKEEPVAACSTGAIKRTSIPKRKSVYNPKTSAALEPVQESFSPPVHRRKLDDDVQPETPKPIPFSIFEDGGETEKETFKIPQLAPVAKPPVSVFQDDDDCNTQMFNFFIKSQQKSTPKITKTQSLLPPSNEPLPELPQRKGLDFDSSMHELDEEPQSSGWKQPFTSRSSDMDTLNEPNEMYRQKLSAIMEMTEETPTISSSAATASSKSSSVEDFDFTKTHQSTTNRSSAVLAKTSNMSKVSNFSKVSEVPVTFDRSLPPAAQFCIYEDEQELTNTSKHSGSEKEESTIVARDTEISASSVIANKSKFDFSQNPSKSVVGVEKTADILQFTANQSKNFELKPPQKDVSAMFETELRKINHSIFKMPKEDTVPTTFMMNFNEEKTEKLPDKFNTNEISFKPPTLDEPSMFLPIPNDITMPNIPQISASIFELPKDDTVSAVLNKIDPIDRTTNFSILTMEKTTDIGSISMQNSRKEDVVCGAEVNEVPDVREKSMFEIYQDDTGLIFNKSRKIESKAPTGLFDLKKTSVEDVKAEDEEKENQKMTKSFYANINKSTKNVDDDLWDMISPNRSRGNKSIAKPSVEDELYAMISPSVPKALSNDINKTSVEKSIIKQVESPKIDKVVPPAIESPVLPVKSFTTKPKASIDDELYAMIQSPEFRISTASKVPSMARESMNEQKSIAPCQSLLEPMKEMSIHEYQKNTSVNFSNETGFALSEEIPNTAMFALNMPSIKNSTIIAPNIPGSPNEFKSDFAEIKEEHESLKTITEPFQCDSNTGENDDISILELTGIELTEEEKRFFGTNRSKASSSVAEQSKNATIPKEPTPNTFPQFQISAPVSIRPSQFQPNDTKLTETFNQTDSQMNSSKLTRPSLFNNMRRESRFDGSVFIVEDTDDMAVQVVKGNNSRKESTANNSCKNHYDTNPKLNETLGALKTDVDPFDNHLQNAFLDDIDFHEYIQNLERVLITARLKAIEVDTDLIFHGKTFNILKQVGKGSFGFVYSGQCAATKKLYAFKQERPANLWELYISLEIASRIEDPQMLSGFLSIDYALIGTNSSIFASQFCEYGTLFDVCNRHKANTCRNINELIAMILSEQMLSILDHLHAANIIHGDIKPDNFLLMKKLSYGNNELFIKLIDYGRSIDLNFFPATQTFTTTLNTKNFICTEMMEGRPWKYQIDLFCMASTIYTLVCGKYMNVKRQPGSRLRPYVLAEAMPAFLEVQLWEDILYPLINVRDCNRSPDLQKLRLQIREAVATKERFVPDIIRKFNAILDT